MYLHLTNAKFMFANVLQLSGPVKRVKASQAAVAGHVNELVNLFVHGENKDEVPEDSAPAGSSPGESSGSKAED